MSRGLRDRKELHIALTILIMIFIFIQSALPADLSQQESGLFVRILAGFLRMKEETLSFCVRKCAHFTEYLILGASLCVTVRDMIKEKMHRTAYFCQNTAAWCIGTLYAVTDEIHQAFVPGRSCELRDVLIDSCGVLAGVLIIWHLQCSRASDRSGDH